MATKRLTIEGYGQVELNQVAFRRDGRIEAQCALDSTFFSNKNCENGMLLAVDNIKREVTAPTDSTLPVGFVYSAEHMYDERDGGLKNFKLTLEDSKEGLYPRLGYLAKGDKFTTNCVCYSDSEYASNTALISALEACASTKMYGKTDATGAIAVTSTMPTTGLVMSVLKKTTMPDGTIGVKFQVIAD